MTTNDITLLPPGGNPTMSSLEISDLTGKAHAHVMRDIRVMTEELGGQSNFGSTYRDAQGKERACFNLPRRECLILVSGYSIELRARIIDRWEQLERQAADPVTVLNDPAVMRGLLLTYSEKVLTLEARVAADKPKTSFYDAYINADGLYGLQNAGRALGCHPNKFITWLKQDYVFYQGSALVPRVRFIQMGIFEVKSTIVDDKARPKAFITPKGLTYFASRVPDRLKMSAGEGEAA